MRPEVIIPAAKASIIRTLSGERHAPELAYLGAEYVGLVRYADEAVTFERIILGERIPDATRTVFNPKFDPRNFPIAPIPNAVSGSLGFADFAHDLRNPLYDNSIYLGYMGVEVDQRHQRNGSKLIEALKAIAVRRRATSIWGSIYNIQFEQNFPFFKRNGFVKGRETMNGTTQIHLHLK